MNPCTVLYAGWQMQCCGDPFKIGDSVRWLVLKCKNLSLPIDIESIDYAYEAHSSDYRGLFMLNGIVTDIRALYCNYEVSPDNPQLLIPVSGFTINTDHADGWEKSIGSSKFSDYIVNLKNITIRPAEQSEVTFK